MNTALFDKFGGWPLLEGDKWKEEEHDLTSLLVKLQMHRMMGLFNMIFHNIDPSIQYNVPVVRRIIFKCNLLSLFISDFYSSYRTLSCLHIIKSLINKVLIGHVYVIVLGRNIVRKIKFLVDGSAIIFPH